MLIVDAQIHLWNAGNPTSPGTGRSPPTPRPTRSRDGRRRCRCRGAHAAHAVGSERERAGHRGRARSIPIGSSILGNFPLDKPESRALVDTWKQRPGMLGLRFTFPAPQQSAWLTDGTVDWLWPAAERAGLPIAMMAAELPSEGRRGRPAASEPQADPRSPRSAVGRHGESAGAVGESPGGARAREISQRRDEGHRRAELLRSAPTRSADIHDNLHRLYDAFGPARCFWGTDITRMPCPWRQCVTLFTEELPWLKGRDLELVMGRAVCDWLGWKR